jgi:hypothetical protein
MQFKAILYLIFIFKPFTIDEKTLSMLNQRLEWKYGDIDILQRFKSYRSKSQNPFCLSKDHIADLTEGSKFLQKFSQDTRLGLLEELTPSVAIHNQWPTFKEVSERIFKPGFTFDDVSSAIKDETMKDPIAGYAHNIISV